MLLLWAMSLAQLTRSRKSIMENQTQSPIELPSKIAIRNQDVLWRYLEDQPVEEIALYYKVEPSTIYSILKIPRIQEQLVEWQKKIELDISTRMELLAVEAMEEVREQMRDHTENGSSPSARRECAKLILDRAKPFQRKEETGAPRGFWEALVSQIGKANAPVDEKQDGKDSPIANKE